MIPKAFFFQWQRSAMLDFLNPEDVKGTTFRFLTLSIHAWGGSKWPE